MKKSKLFDKISRNLLIRKKDFVRLFKPRAKEKRILFIVGCQRSGTTLMLRVLENDLNTKTFPEFSKLSSIDKNKIRLNPLDSVNDTIRKVRAPFVVVKPLVETQNVVRLLEYFDGSKALWMYRDYRDVASSNLRHFGIGNGIDDLRPIVEARPKDWRSEGVSKHVRTVVSTHFSEDMNPHDAAVLFWYARNILYFELELYDNPDVIMCKYEDLVTSPEDVLRGLYKNINEVYPGSQIHKAIHSRSVTRGQDVGLSPGVERLAAGLLEKLNRSYDTKNS